MGITPSTFAALAPPPKHTKISRVLHLLCCGHSLNRFEAEHQAHDHALNSTISELANDHGISVVRTWEVVPGFAGKPTRCVRYRIDPAPANLVKCYWLLKSWGYLPPERPTPGPDAHFPREAA